MDLETNAYEKLLIQFYKNSETFHELVRIMPGPTDSAMSLKLHSILHSLLSSPVVENMILPSVVSEVSST